MSRKLSCRRGFTGAELVVVASIIAILIGLLLPNTDQLKSVVDQIDDAKAAPNTRVIRAALSIYWTDYRTVATGLQSVFEEAATTGKLDTARLRILKMKLMVAEDETDIALDLCRDAMQDKTIPRDERKLIQSAIPILVQIRAELHTLGVLIGLLLPAPDGAAGAAVTPPWKLSEPLLKLHAQSTPG